jgi:chromosome partitioning protein
MAAAWFRAGVAALLACAAFAAVVASASGQRDERARDRVQPPTELLREYPFDQGRLRSPERADPPRSGAGSAALPTPGDSGGGLPLIWLALGGAALLGALALVARRAQRPRSPSLTSTEIGVRTDEAGWLVFDTEPSRPRPAAASQAGRFPRRGSRAPAANAYAVANQKGGVGKTTVSLVLGAAAARRGKHVLLVDLDPQASATFVLAADDERPTIADVIVDGTRPLREAVVTTTWGFDLAPAERRLRSADVGAPTEGSALRQELTTVADYDLVLIDCPPSLGRLTIEALTAASRALVVTEPSYLALHAMEELSDALHSIAEDENPSLELGGVILNRLETTAEHRRSVAELEANFGPRLWTPHVPKRAILQDAMRQGVPPQDLATHSHYAGEIASIFDQLVERLTAVALKSNRDSRSRR